MVVRTRSAQGSKKNSPTVSSGKGVPSPGDPGEASQRHRPTRAPRRKELLKRPSPQLLLEASQHSDSEKLHADNIRDSSRQSLARSRTPSPAPSLSHAYPLSITFGDFELVQRIGEGAAGAIYLARFFNGPPGIIIKVQAEEYDIKELLKHEARIYGLLEGLQCIPEVYSSGICSPHRYIAMQRLGPSLLDLCGLAGKLSVRAVAEIAQQVLSHLCEIHGRNVVHRDLKPENILLGLDLPETGPPLIYLIDFGLATRWQNSNGAHRAFRTHRPFIGTYNFASLRSLEGDQVSRRDDVESLGNCMLFLIRGSLPWMTHCDDAHTARTHVVSQKKLITTNQLCDGQPLVIRQFLDYASELPFHAQPNYEHWISIFKVLASWGAGESLRDAVIRLKIY